MNSFAKMLLFAVIAIAVFGVIGMETAEARCHGYNGWYSAPTCYTGGYYARRSCYRYVPNYCGSGGYGSGGYGSGGYGSGGYGSGGYGSGGYGFGYGGW